ncbi:MAG: nucleotidyltransferase domain-containing protein, partial [Clostridiales bacterium]
PIAKKHGVSKVYIFGSYARGEANENSDIDLRINGERIHDLFEFGSLYSDLEEALNKQLDIVTTQALLENQNNTLHKRFFDRIQKDEQLLYEELIPN